MTAPRFWLLTDDAGNELACVCAPSPIGASFAVRRAGYATHVVEEAAEDRPIAPAGARLDRVVYLQRGDTLKPTARIS